QPEAPGSFPSFTTNQPEAPESFPSFTVNGPKLPGASGPFTLNPRCNQDVTAASLGESASEHADRVVGVGLDRHEGLARREHGLRLSRQRPQDVTDSVRQIAAGQADVQRKIRDGVHVP